ncbi:hypothetical protein CMV_029770 [Castanea mollissima]|uniref:Germin-like protein n=1 Tax=Castanea mollissima TaxID=60419 RepID=A0A8J4V3R5_9ROSI|nr:hypothetical protein CMV_029770 [Castanea mollissima]
MAAILALFVMTFAVVLGPAAADPDLLQDVCVADLTSGVKVNGFTCKDIANISAADFSFDGLAKPGLTNNTLGSLVTAANVQKIPGLNTLGVSLSRIDYAPGGLNPPHTHPRATEMVFVLEGELNVGFITTANVLISKSIKKGEIFVFPKGLVHFQKNNATPPVPDNVLTKAFQVGTKEVEKIKSRFAPKK